MRKSIFGFFMLFLFYLVLGYYFLGIGIDFLMFTPFYVFFILIMSLIPSIAITYRNKLGFGKDDNVLLLVNTVHIFLVGIAIGFYVLYNNYVGEVSVLIGYIIYGVSLLLNVVVLFDDLKENRFAKALLMYVFAFIALHFVHYLLEWDLLFFYPMPAIYLLLHNVTIISYTILRSR